MLSSLEGFTMNKKLTRITLWVSRSIFLLLVALLPTMPFLMNWYSEFRDLNLSAHISIMVAFYICAIITSVALLQMDRLLRNILDDQVFVRRNIQLILQVRGCCGLIALVCLPAAVFYMPLIFMVVTMAFLWLVVGVVAQTLDAAVAIREENDLTI